IEWVEAYLDGLAIPHSRVPNADGTKSNLMATIGPAIAGGVVLSGHTDVVPLDGQPWTSDPFSIVERDGRLYGRGTCDMKGFLALALAAVPDLLAANPKKPVHLAFSYDEEIGCLGAPAMIEVIRRELPMPAFVVVGEPTDMVAVSGHKGITYYRVTVTGREAHSSQTQLGVSAIMEAVGLMASLTALSARLERDADPASPFTPKGATLTIGLVSGGTAGNILARECSFLFDLRCPPGLDPQAILAPFFAEAAALDAALRARAPEAGVAVVQQSSTPAFAPEPDGRAESFARRLAGDNGPPRAVAFATEAGQFQQAGFSTVLCGPGSIEQAHQPNEYVEVAQMARGRDFMRRLVEWAASAG
ncbi:MAG: acetylornithine deacetylase, partial [Phenylobacterium sp.]|nr:acetylornithine deacetylase [Phenylobacterium sp.]